MQTVLGEITDIVTEVDAVWAQLDRLAETEVEITPSRPAPGAVATSTRQRRTVIAACLSGTALEWYDFFLYGTAAALVFGRLFFPAAEPATGTLLAFATYGVGFVARPVGAVVFGHFGDRVGRRNVLAVTLLLIGMGTFLIGLLPSYASIGLLAPALLVLLRFVQGLSLGGEWGGAVPLSMEHSDPARRGLATSCVQVGCRPATCWRPASSGWPTWSCPSRSSSLTGAVAAAGWVFVFFPLLDVGSFPAILLAVGVALLIHAAMYGPQTVFIAELFSTRLRYSGTSLGYQLAGVPGGALAPVLAILLYDQFGSTVAVSLYVLAALGVTVAGVLSAPPVRQRAG
ncbi:MFS transporter [Solwaraspora sp. WMMB335]|uniref:MFS transporter n=1 Tax=Solwaraspora sp. WMMB335 TaxID=3404118 RepID=UPI003B93BA2A